MRENTRYAKMFGRNAKIITNINKEDRSVTTIIYVDEYKVIATANCSPEDVFNEEYGSKLSYLRAKRALCSTLKEEAIALQRALRKEINDLERYKNKVQKSREQATDKIKEMYN